MVHIFAGDDHHSSNIRGLSEVLTTATLSIFQQGTATTFLFFVFRNPFSCSPSHIYSPGPRDHPDIAESFMHLHAQVGQMHVSIDHSCIRWNPFFFSHHSACVFLIIRFLKENLICTCLISWIKKLCFTVVSIVTCFYCSPVSPLLLFYDYDYN